MPIFFHEQEKARYLEEVRLLGVTEHHEGPKAAIKASAKASAAAVADAVRHAEWRGAAGELLRSGARVVCRHPASADEEQVSGARASLRAADRGGYYVLERDVKVSGEVYLQGERHVPHKGLSAGDTVLALGRADEYAAENGDPVHVYEVADVLDTQQWERTALLWRAFSFLAGGSGPARAALAERFGRLLGGSGIAVFHASSRGVGSGVFFGELRAFLGEFSIRDTGDLGDPFDDEAYEEKAYGENDAT